MGAQCFPDATSFEAMSIHVRNLAHENPGNWPDKLLEFNAR